MVSKLTKLAVIASLTFLCYAAASPFAWQANSAEKVALSDSAMAALQRKAVGILVENCARSGCHAGKDPAMGRVFSADTLIESSVNVPSAEIKTLMLINPGRPEESYILLKVRGDKGIKGRRMPLDARPLKPEEINTVEQWIENMPADTTGSKGKPSGTIGQSDPPQQGSQASRSGFRTPAFFGRTVINLPTAEPLDQHEVLLRIEHRFFFITKSSYQGFYGFDGPADVLIALEYGITNRWSASLGRTNEEKEVDLSTSYTLLEQGVDHSMPFSAAGVFGASLSTLEIEGRRTFSGENFHMSGALSLSRQFTDRLSFLVVPAFSYNTDYANPKKRDSFALGLGGRFMFMENGCLVGELLPTVSGFRTARDSWSLGLEAKHGGHVFHFFVTNALGLTQNQYIPGGDLEIAKHDVRLGFTIYRILGR